MNIFYNKRGTIQTIVLVIVLFTVVAGGSLFFYFIKTSNTNKPGVDVNTVQIINGNQTIARENNIPEPSQPSEPENPALRDNCVSLPDNLESCSAYKCLYLYQKAGVELTNEVVGLVDGKCNYKEQTKNIGINLNCEFTDSTRQAVVDFYRNLKLYDPANQTGEPVMDYNFYMVGNKKVQDPLLEAVMNGECKS